MLSASVFHDLKCGRFGQFRLCHGLSGLSVPSIKTKRHWSIFSQNSHFCFLDKILAAMAASDSATSVVNAYLNLDILLINTIFVNIFHLWMWIKMLLYSSICVLDDHIQYLFHTNAEFRFSFDVVLCIVSNQGTYTFLQIYK